MGYVSVVLCFESLQLFVPFEQKLVPALFMPVLGLGLICKLQIRWFCSGRVVLGLVPKKQFSFLLRVCASPNFLLQIAACLLVCHWPGIWKEN